MSSTIAQVGIAITADDKTAKGLNSAERRTGRMVTKIGSEVEKVGGKRGLGGLGKTFVEVEAAAAEAFGSRSVLGTLSTRLGAVRKIGATVGTSFGRASVSMSESAVAGAAAAEGMEGAATAAGGLVAAMGPVAVVGATAVAVLGAAAVAGYKFSSSWAASTAQMGRFAEMIGVSTKNLQELQAAGERFGIGKDVTNSGVSNFATAVHDARYGRSNDTLALLTRLGVKFSTKSDGTLDYNKMLGDTSDALARQRDPQTSLMIANRLGIAGMLPMLRKGSGTLRSEMALSGRRSAINSDADVATAERFQYQAALLGQMADRAKQRLQAGTAAQYAPQMERAALLFDRSVTEDFAPAAKRLGDAADHLGAAATRMGAPRSASGDSLFDRILSKGERSQQGDVSNRGAIGVAQLMPKTAQDQARRMGIAFDEHRLRTDAGYNAMLGRGFLDRMKRRYNGDDVLATAAYNAGPGAVDRWIKRYGDPRKGQISDREFWQRIPGHGPGTYQETRDYVGRVIYNQEPAQQRHHHTHEIHVHPDRVSVKTTTRGSDSVAISHAPVGR